LWVKNRVEGKERKRKAKKNKKNKLRVPALWCRRTSRPTAAGTPHLLAGEEDPE